MSSCMEPVKPDTRELLQSGGAECGHSLKGT